MIYVTQTEPCNLPCDTAPDEYGPKGYLNAHYGAFKGRGYLPPTPEQQKAQEARRKRLDEALAEIERDMLARRKN